MTTAEMKIPSIDELLRESASETPSRSSGSSKRILLADSSEDSSSLKSRLEGIVGKPNVTHVKEYSAWQNLPSSQYDAYIIDPSFDSNKGFDVAMDVRKADKDLGKLWVLGKDKILVAHALDVGITNTYLKSWMQDPHFKNTTQFLRDIADYLRTIGEQKYS